MIHVMKRNRVTTKPLVLWLRIAQPILLTICPYQELFLQDEATCESIFLLPCLDHLVQQLRVSKAEAN